MFPTDINCNTNPPCVNLKSPEINLSALVKPLAKVAQGAINAYLGKQLWNTFLGLEVELEPEVKGSYGLCCTNNVQLDEVTAEVSGQVKLTSNKRNINQPIKESLPNFAVGPYTGTLDVDGTLFIGTAAQPAIKMAGSYKAGCGSKKPEWEISVGGSVTLKSGVFGDVTAKFSPIGGIIPPFLTGERARSRAA